MKKSAYFLLLCFAAFLTSCSEDDHNKSHKHDDGEPKIKMGKVSFQDMKSYLLKHTNSSFPASLDPSFNKGGDTFITVIDTTNISQITNGDVTTFTLHVNTLDDELYAYSNLVIKSEGGKTEESILHYNPTAEWQAAYDAGERLPYDGDLTITDVNGEQRAAPGGTCMLEIAIACYGSSCPCTDGNGQTFYVTISCGGGGGGSDPGNGTPTNPTPGGFPPMDGGGGGNYTDFDYFMMGLSNQQKAWLTSNPVIMTQVYNYLASNGYSYEAEGFAVEWINDLMTGNLEHPLNHLFIAFQNNYRGQMSDSELAIFDTLSPQSQYKYLKNAYFASERAKEWYPDSLHNGKGDAFRHAYFNALNVLSIGEAYAQLLSTAHEEIIFNPQNVYQYKEKEMDLHNNQIGRNWGVHYLTFSNISIRELIRNALNNGELRYLTPLGYTTSGGIYHATWANQNSQSTPTNQ